MSDRVEPGRRPDGHPDAGERGGPPFSLQPARALTPGRDSRQRALVGETQTGRLVCVSLIGLALGVACGLWINARLASATSRSAPVRLLPDAHAGERTAVASTAVQPPPDHSDDAPPPAEEITTPAAPDAEGEGGTSAVADEGRGRKSGGGGSNAAAAGENRAPASTDWRRARGAAGETRETAARARGGAGPCALYTSAGALNLRSGAATTLVLGGPGAQGVTVSTPDWSDIVVFPEGAAGGKGWVKYSVRSVSKRPGVYAVRFKTRCGSQTVRVTVGRP